MGCSHSGMFSEMFRGLFSGLFTQWMFSETSGGYSVGCYQ